jgi:hypothetical protein
MNDLIVLVCLVLVSHYSDKVWMGKTMAVAMVALYYLQFCCCFFRHLLVLSIGCFIAK